jgi:electron transfer flavoprotein beta subunit
LNAQQIGVDPKFVGLPGSPTIVYRVERIPKAKATRRAELIDGSDTSQLGDVVKRICNLVDQQMIIK